MNTERLKEVLAQARSETGKVIIGQHDVIEKALIAIFTGNHALVEGVPGVAKTLLVRTLARVLGPDFARIQFTPMGTAFAVARLAACLRLDDLLALAWAGVCVGQRRLEGRQSACPQ